jgi:hypothetical protein
MEQKRDATPKMENPATRKMKFSSDESADDVSL